MFCLNISTRFSASDGMCEYLKYTVCSDMQEPYLITKLESAEKTWKELSVCSRTILCCWYWIDPFYYFFQEEPRR